MGPLLIRSWKAEDACAAAEMEYAPEVKRYAMLGFEIPNIPKLE